MVPTLKFYTYINNEGVLYFPVNVSKCFKMCKTNFQFQQINKIS